MHSTVKQQQQKRNEMNSQKPEQSQHAPKQLDIFPWIFDILRFSGHLTEYSECNKTSKDGYSSILYIYLFVSCFFIFVFLLMPCNSVVWHSRYWVVILAQ